MSTTMIVIIAIIAIIVILALAILLTYNGLVKLRNRVQNAWSQIDVQLNRRAELIPNLLESVKGYMKHENEVLTKVTEARSGLLNASTVKEFQEADNMLTSSLKSLFAVAEAYPDLKANENFIALQNQLGETEDKISYSRQFYNDTVLMYNNKCQTVPSNIIANMFGFKIAEFFEAAAENRIVPEVKF